MFHHGVMKFMHAFNVTKRWMKFYSKLENATPNNFYRSSIIRQTMPMIPDYDPKIYLKKFGTTVDRVIKKYQESKLFSPVKNRFKGKKISKITEVYIYYASLLLNYFKDIGDFKILEIGPGFGGLCRVLKSSGFSNGYYYLLDHPTMLSFSESFLGDMKKIKRIPISRHKDLESINFDMMISTHCISETENIFKEWVYNKIFPNTKNIFMVDGDGPSSDFKKNLITAIKSNFQYFNVVNFQPKIRDHSTDIFIGKKI